MNKKLITNIFFYLLVVAIALVVLFPFLWMLASSFKTQVDIISWPPKFIFSPTLQNYQKVFGEQDFLKYFLNSTIVGSLAVGLSLVLGWWGIPWGFLWTPFSILRNLTGGINVTQSIVPSLKDHSLERRLDQDTNHWEEAAAFLKTVKPMSRSGAAGA